MESYRTKECAAINLKQKQKKCNIIDHQGYSCNRICMDFRCGSNRGDLICLKCSLIQPHNKLNHNQVDADSQMNKIRLKIQKQKLDFEVLKNNSEIHQNHTVEIKNIFKKIHTSLDDFYKQLLQKNILYVQNDSLEDLIYYLFEDADSLPMDQIKKNIKNIINICDYDRQEGIMIDRIIYQFEQRKKLGGGIINSQIDFLKKQLANFQKSIVEISNNFEFSMLNNNDQLPKYGSKTNLRICIENNNNNNNNQSAQQLKNSNEPIKTGSSNFLMTQSFEEKTKIKPITCRNSLEEKKILELVQQGDLENDPPTQINLQKFYFPISARNSTKGQDVPFLTNRAMPSFPFEMDKLPLVRPKIAVKPWNKNSPDQNDKFSSEQEIKPQEKEKNKQDIYDQNKYLVNSNSVGIINKTPASQQIVNSVQTCLNQGIVVEPQKQSVIREKLQMIKAQIDQYTGEIGYASKQNIQTLERNVFTSVQQETGDRVSPKYNMDMTFADNDCSEINNARLDIQDVIKNSLVSIKNFQETNPETTADNGNLKQLQNSNINYSYDTQGRFYIQQRKFFKLNSDPNSLDFKQKKQNTQMEQVILYNYCVKMNEQCMLKKFFFNQEKNQKIWEVPSLIENQISKTTQGVNISYVRNEFTSPNPQHLVVFIVNLNLKLENQKSLKRKTEQSLRISNIPLYLGTSYKLLIVLNVERSLNSYQMNLNQDLFKL